MEMMGRPRRFANRCPDRLVSRMGGTVRLHSDETRPEIARRGAK